MVATRKDTSQVNTEDQDSLEVDDENSAIDLQDLVNAEQLEIIIGCLEEVHNVLINANELLVSIHCKCSMDNFSYRLKKNEIYHHSWKEHFKVSKMTKFGREML